MIIAAWGTRRFLQKPLAKVSANLRASLVTKEEKIKAETAVSHFEPKERDSVTKKTKEKAHLLIRETVIYMPGPMTASNIKLNGWQGKHIGQGTRRPGVQS